MLINNRKLRTILAEIKNDEREYLIEKEKKSLKLKRKKLKEILGLFLPLLNHKELIHFYNASVQSVYKKRKLKKLSKYLITEFRKRELNFKQILNDNNELNFSEIVFLQNKDLVFIVQIDVKEATGYLNYFIQRNDPTKETFDSKIIQYNREKVSIGLKNRNEILSLETYRLAHTYIRKEMESEQAFKAVFYYLVIKRVSIDELFPFGLQIFLNLTKITHCNKDIMIICFMSDSYMLDFIYKYLKPFGLLHKEDFVTGFETPYYKAKNLEADESEVTIDAVPWLKAKNTKEGNFVEYLKN